MIMSEFNDRRVELTSLNNCFEVEFGLYKCSMEAVDIEILFEKMTNSQSEIDADECLKILIKTIESIYKRLKGIEMILNDNPRSLYGFEQASNTYSCGISIPSSLVTAPFSASISRLNSYYKVLLKTLEEACKTK